MLPLEQPDSAWVDAAQGWCELQQFDEASAELEKVDPAHSSHPLVLEARWQISANLGDWTKALDQALAVTKVEPNWPNGWIYLANSLAMVELTQEAYDTLKSAQQKFPEQEIICYDLACLCENLDRRDEARKWIQKAIDLGGEEIRLRAISDPDLEGLIGNC